MAKIGEVFGSAAAIAKGMGITFREMLQPSITEEYPDAPARLEERYRGAHVLQRDENGLEKCVACFLCAAACPADCIYIEAAENTDQERFSGGERYAKVYNIDYNRCIFCGYCVEACPTDAITHGHGFELASYNTSTLIYRKEQMLVPLAEGGAEPSQHNPPPAGAVGRVETAGARS
ncbi:MAG TPA: NADH-quinone oxidoreductase subunit NuoI [Bryobacteraceae bacterium]|nr:NADH-quinone oxidoreductase subunit NuoI [Bryobacteraceae bacterium]